MTLDLIIWHDAHSEDEWKDAKDLPIRPCTIVTLGLVIKESDATVAVSTSYSLDDDVAATMIIPKACILKRQIIARKSKVEEWLATARTLPRHAWD